MSKEKVEIYPVGTKVKLEEDVFGTITRVSIFSNDYITYECGWWNSRSYSSQSFTKDEIEAVLTTSKQKIGFIN
jgi:uncharacterized protein YodC (DUF2158 family)